MQRVHQVEDLPIWSQNTVRFLLAQDFLQRDDEGFLPADEVLLHLLVVLDRAGIFETSLFSE